jgi:purine-binding chemotaxis protein CheW
MPEQQMTLSRAGATRDLITFRVGAQDFCIAAHDVKEIRVWSPETRLPASPAWVRGVINLRGTILPVVDLAMRLGMAPTDCDTTRPAVIVVSSGRRLVGLLVDSVCDIVEAPDEALQPTPETGCVAVAALAPFLVTIGDRVAGLIAADRILPDAGAGQ